MSHNSIYNHYSICHVNSIHLTVTPCAIMQQINHPVVYAITAYKMSTVIRRSDMCGAYQVCQCYAEVSTSWPTTACSQDPCHPALNLMLSPDGCGASSWPCKSQGYYRSIALNQKKCVAHASVCMYSAEKFCDRACNKAIIEICKLIPNHSLRNSSQLHHGSAGDGLFLRWQRNKILCPIAGRHCNFWNK